MSAIILGDWIEGGQVKINLARLLETRMLIQANSGGGKSQALRCLLEQAAGKVQQLIIDPEGEFASLREKFDLVVCAAQGADAATHPRTAGLLARRLLETEASAVLDISELKAHDRHVFTRVFIEALIEAPKSLRHPVLVALDEAQIFAPEKGQGESEASGAVIDLATRGRKRGLCLVAATQRISMFHKAVAGELKNRLIGGTSLDVDVKRAAFDLGLPPKDALARLRALEPGHFFGFGPALNQLEPRELVTGEIQTTHPKVGHRQWTAPPKPTAAIVALLPKLADLPREAEEEARTVEALRRENFQLKRDLKAAPAAAADSKAIERAVETALQTAVADGKKQTITTRKHIERLQRALSDAMKFIVSITAEDFFKEGVELDQDKIQAALKSAVVQIGKQLDAKFETQQTEFKRWRRQGELLLKNIESLLADGTVPVDVTVRHQSSFSVAAPAAAPARVATSNDSFVGNGTLPIGEEKILTACIQFPDGLRREQLTVLTGQKRSTRDAYVQRLRAKGLIEVAGDRILATDAGTVALPNASPLPTGAELQSFWIRELPEGEAKILQVLIDRYPGSVTKDAITEETGFMRSTRDAYLQRMRAKQIVDEPARGEVRASATFF